MESILAVIYWRGCRGDAVYGPWGTVVRTTLLCILRPCAQGALVPELSIFGKGYT